MKKFGFVNVQRFIESLKIIIWFISFFKNLIIQIFIITAVNLVSLYKINLKLVRIWIWLQTN
jgi:hypothetical protein